MRKAVAVQFNTCSNRQSGQISQSRQEVADVHKIVHHLPSVNRTLPVHDQGYADSPVGQFPFATLYVAAIDSGEYLRAIKILVLVSQVTSGGHAVVRCEDDQRFPTPLELYPELTFDWLFKD